MRNCIARGLAEIEAQRSPRPVRCGLAVPADHNALVEYFPAAIAGAVVDDEGLGATGKDAHAVTGQDVVYWDPGLWGRLERIYDLLGECGAPLGYADSGRRRLGSRSVVSYRSRSSTHAAGSANIPRPRMKMLGEAKVKSTRYVARSMHYSNFEELCPIRPWLDAPHDWRT